jgi:hypothetical protein
MKKVQKLALAAGSLLGVIFLWPALREEKETTPLSPQPPISRLKAYALSNAPAFAAPGLAWTTNGQADSNVAALVRHVTGRLKASQANQTNAQLQATECTATIIIPTDDD